MIKTRASALVASPADRVFQFIAIDFFKKYKWWSPEVISLHSMSKGAVQIGTTARQIRIDQGRRTEATFRVCAFETGKRIEFQKER